jgi:hypothetical protein
MRNFPRRLALPVFPRLLKHYGAQSWEATARKCRARHADQIKRRGRDRISGRRYDAFRIAKRGSERSSRS